MECGSDGYGRIGHCATEKQGNGCFWHGHEDCRYFVWPQNNAEFWKNKISGNIQRDRHNRQLLADQGWRVIDIWECELKKSKVNETLLKLTQELCCIE